MTTKAKFTTELRERFLTLLETGANIEEACADIGISRATITKWAARGRKAGADEDAAEFAFRFDEIKEGTNERGLTKDDLIRLLEKQARKGSVQATLKLLERPWEKKDADKDAAGRAPDEEDPFAALEGDQLAQRRAKRRAS